MSSNGFAGGSEWHWPDSSSSEPQNTSGLHHRAPGTFDEEEHVQQPETSGSSQSNSEKPHRTWPSRTCRICLEVVPPTFLSFAESLPGFLQGKPRVTYISEDPELGRLIRPCKCKGSSRYVHEGCLRTWRHSSNSIGSKNFYACPTCGFKYRLSRMTWGRLISSTVTQLGLTFAIFFLAVFLLGFVADPIINIYLDPYDTLTSTLDPHGDPLFPEDLQNTGWIEHLIKGLASLGLLGFVKVFFALNPLHWWNLRTTGIFSGGGGGGGGVGGGRRGGGRDRVAGISRTVIIMGVLTFLWVS
jgi:hypothetical protein